MTDSMTAWTSTRIRSALLASCVACAACGGSGSASTDAPSDSPGSRGSRVFLQFEGVQLTRGSEDATQNTIDYIPISPVDIPPFMEGDLDRTDRIAAITTSMTEIFAPFDVEIVTTRPASGLYDMAVFGGSFSDLQLPGDAPHFVFTDCTDRLPTSISLVFTEQSSLATASADVIASTAVTNLALGHGIPETTEPEDCACWECRLTGRCIPHGPGTPIADAWMGGCDSDQTTVDVLAEFTAAFGTAP